MEDGQLWRQYFVAGVANIAVLGTGVCMGWTAPINSKLADNSTTSTSPLPIIPTKDQISWIGSLLSVGAIFGPFIGGLAASKLGRKWGLMTSSIPLFIGWILVLIATDMYFLYAGRISWGIAVGMIFTISPMYCAEIATDECRGALGSYLQAFITVGFLLVYAIGPYVTYNEVAYFGVIIIAMFCVSFFFMPETPTYYLLKNDRLRAADSLCILRGRSMAGVEIELDQIERNVKASMEKKATIKDIFKRGNFKGFYISCALVLFQQLSGVNAVLFYLTDIFDDSGTSVDPAIATIIVGAVQAGASFMTPFVVDKLGRRLLLLVSSCGTAIGLVLLGTFFLLKADGSPIVSSIGFLPLLSLVVFIVTYCWGLGPLPWAVMGEVFPVEVKAAAAPIATALSWVLCFLVTRYFEPIALAIGRYVAFWIFAIFCVISFFFTLFVVPETKGKSLQEIQDMLAGRQSTKPEKS